jgi:integrase
VRRPWNDAVEKANLERRPTPHDLRHSHASWLIAAGVDIKSVSIRLGHSSSVITLDIYGHLMGDADEIAVKRLENARKKSLRLAQRASSGTKAEQNPDQTDHA